MNALVQMELKKKKNSRRSRLANNNLVIRIVAVKKADKRRILKSRPNN